MLPHATHNPLHECQALVVEGNPQCRAILVAQMRELGIAGVHQCARVSDARRKLEHNRFDIVICEQFFERDSQTGQELLDDLRRNQILPFSTVFVMLTAEASYSRVAEAAESALDAYLLKPHTGARLTERIVQARRRKVALQAIFQAIDDQDHQRAADLCLARFQARAPYWLYAARIGAELLLRAGRIPDAQALYEAVIQAKTVPWARLGVARAQLEDGQHAKALTTLQSLLQEDNAYADAYDLMGRAQFEQGQFDAALSTFEMATRLTPNSITRLLKHGMLAYYSGERSAGLDLLEKATRLGADSKMYDPQALVLLAMAALDNNDHRQLMRCVAQLTRIYERSFEPERPRRLLLVVQALNALQHRQQAQARDHTETLMADVRSPEFDVESACNLLGLMGHLLHRGGLPHNSDAVIDTIALRFGTSRALSDWLAKATPEETGWRERLRAGYAEIVQRSASAMHLSLKGDPCGTVTQLLREGQATLNGKLIETAQQVLLRYRDRIPEAETLEGEIQALRASYGLRQLKLGDPSASARPLGGMALPIPSVMRGENVIPA